ncbi:L-lysine 6-transaminase [Rhodococcoides corynebacterioides]|uniref:L-lysine-epsilon aminotransferase n=1 Tax=Rhodococcoides corynebacterioides TaxID=53972 RepID=A0ABS7P3M5_9NOCA|nr:L-lysine 6-transaminase [Rhodococcus corynebacterioides]MBY6367017.1 L-lysine 6-transaminase [Rhodococcus corynebacterioides]MBY6407278.1 L-lysine 6-transaminase [Rhodococcus corynebacterioides]
MTQVLPISSPPGDPSTVHESLSRHLLVDGFDLVLDLHRSSGATIVDARTGTAYLDMFTFFASNALGMNHPALVEDAEFRDDLLTAALHKPSNSDVYTEPMARFVDTFARVLGVPELPHLFFVEGGALAVENALKVAFDWKSRRNEDAGRDPRLGTRIMHLEHAFHGRSGYTMSLTNTDPIKVARYPAFDWPRIPSAYVREGADMDALERRSLAAAREHFDRHPHDIAALVLEPIQGEGGDHHFRPAYLRALQDLCHEYDALFVVDEVQTGVGITGTAWAHTQLGLEPDVVAFGKKTQVCGIMAGRRVDLVRDNVFRVGSRINSTWGGGLADMVRARRILEVIERDGLVERAAQLGEVLGDALTELAVHHPGVSEVRGRGLMRAISLPDSETRDAVLTDLREREHVLMLGCGSRSIRFRPALTVTEGELRGAVDALDRVLSGQHTRHP